MGPSRPSTQRTGRRSGKRRSPPERWGGATATAGGLLFAGQSGTGQFQAFNAKTGKLLWQNNAGGRIDDAASVYSVNGTEYVLIPVGGSSLAGSQLGGLNTSNATFVAYKLGSSVTWTPQKGAAALAPTPAPSKAPAPAPSKAPTTPAGTVRVNKYMSYSAKQKTVDLHILGGEGSENNGFNFDGLSGGKLNITIPQGWKVKVTFTNQGSLNHSVFVMAQNGSPNPPITPAFKGATTPNPLVGMKTGASATFTFTAAKPGKYKWVCAVPGHYQLGMWDWLTVSTSGTPTYNANFSG